VATEKHRPSLPYQRVGDFVIALRKRQGVGAQALQFAILTGARASEVRFATWSEIDLDRKVWTVPASRMLKTRQEHRVPLSDAAIAVLQAQPAGKPDEFVFTVDGHRLSENAMANIVKAMNGKEPKWVDPRQGDAPATPHGFRSSLRNWAGASGYPRELAEIALSRLVGDEVERAYATDDLLERRRPMMDAWSVACATPSAPAKKKAASRV